MGSARGHRLGLTPQQHARHAEQVQRAMQLDDIRGYSRLGTTPQHITLARHYRDVVAAAPGYLKKLKSGTPLDEDDLELVRTGLQQRGYRVTNLGGGSYAHVFGVHTSGPNPEALALKVFLTESEPENIAMFGRPLSADQMTAQAGKAGLLRRLTGLHAIPVTSIGPSAALSPRIGGDVGQYKGSLITPQRVDLASLSSRQADELSDQIVRNAVMDYLTGKIDATIVNNTAVLDRRLPSGGSRLDLVSLDNDIGMMPDLAQTNHHPWMPELLHEATKVLGPQRTMNAIIDTVDRALVATDLHPDLHPYGTYVQQRAAVIPDMNNLWTSLTKHAYSEPAGSSFADHLVSQLREKAPTY